MEEHHPQYGWMVVVVIIVAAVAWVYSSNRPDQSNYDKGATHNEQQRQDWPLSIHVGEGGCATFGADKIMGKNRAVKNDPNTGSQSNRAAH